MENDVGIQLKNPQCVLMRWGGLVISKAPWLIRGNVQYHIY
jgi:hypothetical protein